MLHLIDRSKLTRRKALLTLASTLAAWGLGRPESALGKAPIRMLVGAAPGSVMDIAARQIGEALAKQIGQTVYIDNRASAGGIQALVALRSALPDGQTICLVHATQMSAAPSLFELPYDTVSDFSHLGVLFSGPQVLVVHPALPVNSWAELLAQARENPSKFRYASAGNGTPGHMTMEQIKFKVGANMQHIPYKGAAGIVAVLNGEVDLLLEGVMPLLPYIRTGKLRALAIGGKERVPVLSGVQTFEEAGVAGIGTVWVGVTAPAQMPRTVVLFLNTALAGAVLTPSLRASFESTGRLVSPGSPEDMKAKIQAEIPVWRDLIRQSQIRPD